MGVLTTGNTFSTGDQVTASKLNAAVNSATLQAAAVDNTSTQLSSGAIIVKDLGITQDKIASDAVGTNQLANDVVVNTSGSITTTSGFTGNVTGNITGNVTGGTGSFTTLAASGVVSVADGSESAPAITNTGDTNTGIYFPAENSVALTAGAGATLTSTNTAITIGVPTSIVSTAQSDLTLQGGDANSKNLIFKKASAQQGKISAVGDELKFYAGTSGTESLEITTTGVVVPGTISVTGLIKQSGDTGFLDIQGGDTAGANIELYGASHASHANDAFYDADSHSFRPANGSSTNVVINSSGNVGIGTATPEHSLSVFKAANAARTEIGIDNTDQRLVLGSFYQSGGLQYATIQSTNNAETGAQALALQPDGGNVGIGTASPSKKLQISSDANAQSTAAIPGIRIENTDTTASDTNVSGEIEFFSKDASEADKISGFIKNVAEDAGTKYALTFGAKATGANAAEAMRINNAGNVGIGTVSPAKLLHVKSSNSDTAETLAHFGNGDIDGGLEIKTNGNGGSSLDWGFNAVNSRNLVFDTNQTERMRISSAGNIGIGDNNPSKELVVKNISTAGTESVINIISGNAAVAGLYLGDSDDDIVAGIVYDNSADTLQLRSSNNQTAVTIDSSERVGIGTPTPSAPLEVASTTGGVILPRMSTSDRTSISSPANGEMVYDTSLNKFYGYANGAWVAFH